MGSREGDGVWISVDVCQGEHNQPLWMWMNVAYCAFKNLHSAIQPDKARQAFRKGGMRDDIS